MLHHHTLPLLLDNLSLARVLLKIELRSCDHQGFFLSPVQEVLFDVKETEILVQEKASSKVSE